MKGNMGKIVVAALAVLAVVALVAFAGPADAGKPRDNNGDFLGNGFPSGPHFNLNMLGKRDNFSCPAPVFEVLIDGNGDEDEGTAQTQAECEAEGDTCGDQVFSNVIFMPRKDDPISSNFTDPITILVESGRKGPKSNPDATELEVTDWCTESFADFGEGGQGDGATVRLPKDPDGYAVYSRITGRPGDGDGATFTFEDRELKLVEDEFGNDLLLIGLINEDGAFTPTGEQLTRFDTTKNGRGVRMATDITALFQFVGTACNINDVTGFCVDESGNDILDGSGNPVCFPRVDENGIVKQVCCAGANLDSNGDVSPALTCPDDPADPSDGYAYCLDIAGLNADLTAYECSVAYQFEDLSAVCLPDGSNSATCNAANNGDGICEIDETCIPDLIIGQVEDLSAVCLPDGSNSETCNAANNGDGICDPAETCQLGDAALCEAIPQCRTFTENDGQWIFNIADFVNLQLNTENNGSYNVKLRFYPLPLNTDAQ